MSNRVIPWLAAALALGSADARAQTVDPVVEAQGALTFGPDYFAAYAPQTALDMVRRVPGFTLDEGEERRGFSASIGNLLIDGAPPAGKSEDLDDLLERIPASDVVRLELIRGGAGASGAQSVRLNVVRRPSDGEGAWEISLERFEDGRASPAGRLSWTGRRGAIEYGLTGAFELSHTPVDGLENAHHPSGALDETERERIVEDDEEGRLSAELTMPFSSGTLSITSALSRDDGRERQRVLAFDNVGAFEESEDVTARDIEDIVEVSATHRRQFGAWSVELAGLATRTRVNETETNIQRDENGVFDEAEWQDRALQTGESVLRAGAVREFSSGASIRLDAETAFNTLEQRLSLTEDEGVGPTPISAPGANVRIEELRGELSATFSWRPAPRWTIEAGSAFEISQLDQSGYNEVRTELAYWKPSLQMLRSVGGDDQLRFRLYRDFGQLDFEDFAASAELESSTIDAGNPNLRPETSWRFEAGADWRFDDAALELVVYYWAIEDALDFVPVGAPGDQFDARGNIGDASLRGIRVAIETPFPVLANARLRGEGTLQESEATDPLTSETRPQSEILESRIAAEFRQDFSDLHMAWGLSFERERLAPEIRLDRISLERDTDEVEIWIESTAIDGVKIRLFAESFDGARAVRERDSYDPDRNGAFEGAQHRVREYGPVLGLSLQGSF